MMGVAHLRVVGLSVALGSTKVVDDASLIVDSGEWLTVTGPSGAGKSVLLQAMAGLLPSTGQVLVDGRPLRVHGEDSPGVVMQGYALLPLLTAFETVSLPLQARKPPRAEIQAKVGRALEDLGLTPTASQLVSTLSGGQRQRVAIARALAPEPSVLLLDEPTAELDPDNRAKVLRLLRRHAERGAAVVVVTHDPATIEAADAVIELQPGGRLAGAA